MLEVEILTLGREEAQGLFQLYSIAYINIMMEITVLLAVMRRNLPLPAEVLPEHKDQIIILMKFVKTAIKSPN